jgi:hypothetical protein
MNLDTKRPGLFSGNLIKYFLRRRKEKTIKLDKSIKHTRMMSSVLNE